MQISKLKVHNQARSQDFSWGRGGGGAYVRNRDQIINVWMVRYANSEEKQGRVSNLRSKSNGDDF